MIVLTRGVNDRAAENVRLAGFVLKSLRRHRANDWGEMDEEDKKANDEALEMGGRLFSAYESRLGKIWIITEWDRSATTVLFPDEYVSTHLTR